jgi:phospholipid/cholesterol/gamma-HCH transport system substrate-binding protein
VKAVRILVTLALLAAIAAIAVTGIQRLTGAGTSGYLVRAVFDNSSFVIAGEQVKVAGVTVGTIHAVQLTPQNKAALVLQITNRLFVPFRADAHCQIGLESLLGEQFVQCTPTQSRPAGAPASPPLPAIRSGPDQGQHLLPVQNTTTPVGLDLLNDITRLPQQERLRLIIAGLGAGLDGNGHELNAALRRADPALAQTDRVIAVLAGEDRTLARLTDESARVLAPLSAQRRHLGGFIQHAGAVAVASAQEGQAIQQNLKDFPPFLRQLTPAAARLTNLAGQMTPALQSLQGQAPAINAALHGLGPLAKSSVPALKTLGSVAQRGETVFPRAHALAQQLVALGQPLLPLATDIAAVAQSFDNAGGIEDVMRFIYYYAGSVNGENSLGHYIRSLLEIGSCVTRSPASVPGCGATFATTTTGSSQAGPVKASAASRDVSAAVRHATASASGATATKSLLHYLLAP